MAAILYRLRWFGAMASWHLLVLREELRNSPYGLLTALALLGGVFVYVPLVSIGVQELLQLAQEEGFSAANVSVLPLGYAAFLTWMLGAALRDRRLWWVIATAPVPRAVLGLDRALGIFLVALVLAGPYVWGAIQGADFQPAALFSSIALLLWFSTGSRRLQNAWYPFALLLAVSLGWGLAFTAGKYLQQDLILDDPNHEMLREFLRPLMARLRLPSAGVQVLRAPAALHLAAGLLAMWGLAKALGNRSSKAGKIGVIQTYLARWRDAPAALAVLEGLNEFDTALLQGAMALAFALAARSYGFLAAPLGLVAWWALMALWWPVWSRYPTLPAVLGANTPNIPQARRVLLAGRFRALAITLVPLLFLPDTAAVTGVWLGIVWLLQFASGWFVRLNPAWLAGVLAAFGSLVFWLGGRA